MKPFNISIANLQQLVSVNYRPSTIYLERVVILRCPPPQLPSSIGAPPLAHPCVSLRRVLRCYHRNSDPWPSRSCASTSTCHPKYSFRQDIHTAIPTANLSCDATYLEMSSQSHRHLVGLLQAPVALPRNGDTKVNPLPRETSVKMGSWHTNAILQLQPKPALLELRQTA